MGKGEEGEWLRMGKGEDEERNGMDS